ncbi:MAG TPA: methyltransferase domain-containing protein [Pseudomonadales bacterium]|nr:methyltransferase domain-containing protein [Pseudomonadales bacterium]
MAGQEIFENVYRKRQTVLHHMAYMRMAKVLLALEILQNARIDLDRKAIFDYGFGAGTFFLHCPISARIAGVEIDPVHVADVQRKLQRRGFSNVRLQTIVIEQWEQHPLLREQYDIFLCSHVLEHLPDPVKFLCRIRSCIKSDGVFVGLVPLNERRPNPHHVQTCDRTKIQEWLGQAGLKTRCYMESDPWLFWLQPFFANDTGLRHRLAQVSSLILGVPATLLGHRVWEALSPWCARLTGSKPTQAAFVAQPG